jgi:hypothetical protein
MKNQDPDPASGMNIPDHISESLETIFGLKIIRCGSGIFFTLDPGWKNSDPGSGINIPDPQHWLQAKSYSYTGV